MISTRYKHHKPTNYIHLAASISRLGNLAMNMHDKESMENARVKTAKEILKVREDKMRTMGRIITSVFDVTIWYIIKRMGSSL